MARKPKLTPEEKERRKHERSAAKKNAKMAAEIPLFAHLEPQHTAKGEYWRWRFSKAGKGPKGESIDAIKLLDEIVLCAAIRPFARSLVGEEAFAKLDAHCQAVFQAREFWYGFWRDVLCGKRIEFAYSKVENRQPGQPAVICSDWYEHKHMTTEEFYARFPYTDPEYKDFPGAINPLNL